MKSLKQDIIKGLKVITLALFVGLGVSYVSAAWVGPTQAPPGGNAPAPINVSPIGQIKEGGLTLNAGSPAALYGLVVKAGRVGLGTDKPSAALHISSASGPVDVNIEGSASQDARIKFLSSGIIEWFLRNSSASNSFGIGRTSSASDFVIMQSGNVGVGTPNPVAKLEVRGGPVKTTDGLIIETRTTDPTNPETGRIWLRTDI